MAGHKKDIRPGVWRLRLSAGKHPATGKPRYVSKTVEVGPRIADQELAKLVVSAQGARSSATVEQLITEFLRLRERQGIGTRTLASYRTLVKNHVVSHFGAYNIEPLKARHLDRQYVIMAAAGVGISTIEHMHRLVRAALTQAVKWGWVEKNVAKMASPPTVSRTVASARHQKNSVRS